MKKKNVSRLKRVCIAQDCIQRSDSLSRERARISTTRYVRRFLFKKRLL